jgi:hypothetical protein
LACTGVFVVCFLKQLAYVEVLSGLAAWAELLVASVFALEALARGPWKTISSNLDFPASLAAP